jgi:hypothetical protein
MTDASKNPREDPSPVTIRIKIKMATISKENFAHKFRELNDSSKTLLPAEITTNEKAVIKRIKVNETA